MHRIIYRQTPWSHPFASLRPGPTDALPRIADYSLNALTSLTLVSTPARSFSTHFLQPLSQMPLHRLYRQKKNLGLLHTSSKAANAVAQSAAPHPNGTSALHKDPSGTDHATITGRSAPTTPLSTSTSSTPNTGSDPIPSSSSSSSLKESPATKRRIVNTYEWDPEMDALMIALYEAKVNWRTVGKVLERPFTTIYTRFLKALRPKLESGWRPDPIQDRSRLDTLLQQAHDIQEAAALLSKTKAMEAKKLASQAAKIPSPGARPKWDPVADQMIKDLVNANKSWPEIGLALNRPYSSCYTRYFSVLDPALETAWTPEKVTKLTELAKEGVLWKEIGRQLQMKPLACRTKWSELGKITDTPKQTSSLQMNQDSYQDQDQDNVRTDHHEKESMDPTSSSKSKVISFSKEESVMILSLVEKHGQDQWDRILDDFRNQSLREAARSIPPSKNKKSLSPRRKRLFEITTDTLSHHYTRLNRKRYLWTFDEETVLIQQVLRLGIQDRWDDIARATGLHSPEECRTHWKQLDMPVRLNPVAWSKAEQGLFWSLWKQFGTDFDRLARYCPRRSAEDCQKYFDHVTRDFPKEDPVTFAQHVQVFQENLPSTRQKYIFTKEHSLRLQHAVLFCERNFGTKALGAWKWIASRVQKGLSPSSCIEHWIYLRKNMDPIEGPFDLNSTIIKPEKPIAWSHAESMLLDQGIRELGSGWTEIQQRFLPWRNTRAIRQRWLVMSDRSTRVNEDEYYTIVGAGDRSEDIDWEKLARQMPGWNRSPCRRVFETSYKHLVQTTVWHPEEDRLLIEKVIEENGRDWNVIAKHFTGIQPAMAPLYDEAMARLKNDERMSPLMQELQRTHKSAWQCRLRWCQLLEPLMPKGPILSVTEKGRNLIKLSRKLLAPNGKKKKKSDLIV